MAGMTRVFSALAFGVFALWLVTIFAVVALSLGLLALVRDAQSDRIGRAGNRLLRLHQRLQEAFDKLDAAVRICLER
jgi:hypothetical protein